MKSRRWFIFFFFWTILVSLAAYSLWQYGGSETTVILASTNGNDEVWWQIFNRHLYPFYPCILLFPYVLFICTRFPLGLRKRSVVLPTFLFTACAYVFLAVPLVRQVAKNTPTIFYVNSPTSQSVRQSEFADDLVELFREGLSSSSSSAPRIEKLDNGSFKIAHMEIKESKTFQLLIPKDHIGDISGEMLTDQKEATKMIKSWLEVIVTDKDKLIQLRDKYAKQEEENISAEKIAVTNEITPMDSPQNQLEQPLWLTGGLQLGGFFILAGMSHAFVYFRSFRDREKLELKLNQELTQARLTNLKDQIRPHFLFNSLNGISSHIHTDPDLAVDMVANLGGLLRSSIEHQDEEKPFISLEQEMSILDQYFELQSMRFGDRLKITKEISPDALKVQIPAFILQPIVENVIRHVVEVTSTTCEVVIACSLAGDCLKLLISDSGVEANNHNKNPGTGTGLQNIRERLETLYAGGAELSTTFHSDNQGARVEIVIPVEHD